MYLVRCSRLNLVAIQRWSCTDQPSARAGGAAEVVAVADVLDQPGDAEVRYHGRHVVVVGIAAENPMIIRVGVAR